MSEMENTEEHNEKSLGLCDGLMTVVGSRMKRAARKVVTQQ